MGADTSEKFNDFHTSSSIQLVLPQGQHLALFEPKDRELQYVSPLPFSSRDRFVVGSEGWVAAIADHKGSVKCWNTKTRSELIPPTPSRFFARAVALVGQILYIGGDIAESVPFLVLCDLGAHSPQCEKVDIPYEKVLAPDKSIDDILVDGTQLIVADNRVVPNWILAYDITNPLQPRFSRVERLETHGTYERIIKASVGNRWVAILSTTGGQGGVAEHIAIVDKRSFHEQAVISTQPIPSELPRRPWPGPYDWTDIVFWDDCLFVAASEDGLGILDLSKAERINTQICKNILHFVPSLKFQADKVLRVVPGISADCLGVVLESGNGLESVIIGNDFQSVVVSDFSSRLQSEILSKKDLLQLQDHGNLTPFETVDRRNRGIGGRDGKSCSN